MRFGFRELIFLVLLMAMPVAAYFFVFQPRNAQIADARDEIRRKQAKLQQLETYTHSIQDLGLEIDKLRNAITVFERKLPAEREVEVVLKQVWEVAARQGLSPKSVRTDKPVAAAQYSELPLQMQIVGDFDGFYSFLLELEKLPRIMRIHKMQLKKLTNDQGQGGHMQADLVLSVFFDPQDLAPADGASGGRNRS